MALSHILKPIEINGLEIKNRIVRAAHGTSYGRGTASDEMIAYHEVRARDGVGLNILEPAIVHPTTFTHSFYAWTDDVIPGFQKLSRATRQHGMRNFVQLWHGGHRWAPINGQPGLSPSTVPSPLGAVNVPFAMTLDQIDELIEAFAKAAVRAREGELDGVEVHFGHGYLIHQFFAPNTNLRTDEYGGSIENRMRFGQKILRAIRSAAGDDFPLGIRISDSHVPGGSTVEESAEFVRRLCEEKLIDFVDASIGSPFSISRMLGAMDQPAGYMLPDAAQIAAPATVPRILAGRYRTLEEAEQTLRDGDADMVSLVRAMIAEPALITKTLAGRVDEVRPCIGCNQGCVAGIRTPVQRMLCTVNPAVGFEATLHEDMIEKAATPGKVVVVGGGPAGMEAARIAATQGHSVVLFEAQADLGGALLIANRAPKLQGLGDICAWLEQEVFRLGVDVRLSTYAEADDILAEEPDLVIVATGSLPRMDGAQAALPSVPATGVHQPHVLSSHDIFQMPVERLGKTAVVFDDIGHYEAIAVAEHLINAGIAVTFVTRHSSFAPHIEAAVRTDPALTRLRRGKFTLHVRAKLVGIAQEEVTLGFLEGDEQWTVPADTVVLITYNEPLNDVYRDLGGGTRQPKPYKLHLVGDAAAPRDLLVAIREGHMAARFPDKETFAA